MNENLVFLKLGGSLITDKDHPHQARKEMIDQMAGEICQALSADSSLRILVGHGSGSFGHVPAKKYQTRLGVQTREEWRGFAQVWSEARALNQIVVERFTQAGLPVISFPPSGSVITENKNIKEWNLLPIQSALSGGLLPMIYGDVIFDAALGGSILSTEELFAYLAAQFHPCRILIAGEEDGVWEDFPTCRKLIPLITSSTYPVVAEKIFGSKSTDVTGGMSTKVSEVVDLVANGYTREAMIFSPKKNGMLAAALAGTYYGTTIRN